MSAFAQGCGGHALLYLKRITNKDLPYSTGNSARVLWQPGWEGRLGENDTCICMLGPFTVHPKLSQHC